MGRTQDFGISVKIKSQFWIFQSSSAGVGQTYRVRCHSWAPFSCTVLPFEKGGAERKLCPKPL